MKTLVFVKEVPDVRIPVAWDHATGRLRRDWQVRQLDPADRSALELALALKGNSAETQVTAIHLGPPSGERHIRECLALGCDRGFRIWDEGLEEIQPHSHVKALVFSRAAQVLGFDLLFTGAASLDEGNGQVGLWVASYLGIPCITSALNLWIEESDKSLIATRKLDRGRQARVSSSLPAVVTIEAQPESCREPSLPSRLDAWERNIPCLSLSELGVPSHVVQRLNSCLALGLLRFPEPKPKNIPAYDSAQPAFMRIAQLVRGTVMSRTGRLIRGNEAHVVEELFQTLLQEGWLDHLKRKAETESP